MCFVLNGQDPLSSTEGRPGNIYISTGGQQTPRFFLWTKSDMILQPSTDRGRKLTTPM
jgi:hypothetical protein